MRLSAILLALAATVASAGKTSLRWPWTPKVFEPEIKTVNPCAGTKCENKVFDMKLVDTKMSIGGSTSDPYPKPECFQGLFWMQGNPMSDDVASFYGSKFKSMCDEDGKCRPGWPKKFQKAASSKDAKGKETHESGAGTDTELKHVMQVRVANPDVWTWHDDIKGKLGWNAVNAVGLTYQFECDDKAAKCELGGTCNIRARLASWGPLASLMPMQFWMTMQKDPLAKDATKGIIWERRSTALGVSSLRHTYKFRRIVDGAGTHVEGPWEAYQGCVEAGDKGEKKCEVPGEKDKSSAIPASFMPMDGTDDESAVSTLKELVGEDAAAGAAGEAVPAPAAPAAGQAQAALRP